MKIHKFKRELVTASVAKSEFQMFSLISGHHVRSGVPRRETNVVSRY